MSCDAPLRVYVWNGKKYAGEGELVGHRDFVEARIQVYGDETDEERFQRYLVNLEKIENAHDLKNTAQLKDFEAWKNMMRRCQTLPLKFSLTREKPFSGFSVAGQL